MSIKQRAALAVGSGLSGTADVVDNEALSSVLEVTGVCVCVCMCVCMCACVCVLCACVCVVVCMCLL